MWRKIGSCVLGSVCFLSACDKSDDGSKAPAPSSPPLVRVHLEPHPTTEALEKGARKSLSLMYVPVSLTVPEGWVVKNVGDGRVLDGPTPSDNISFQIAAPRGVTELVEKRLEAHANEAKAAYPKLLGKTVVREVTGGKIIEQLSVDSFGASTQPTSASSASAQTSMVEWTYTVLIPGSSGLMAYDLTASLTLKQYMADHAFVRSILDTVKLN